MGKSKLSPPKRGGRPPLGAKRKRATFNTRLDENVRAGLEREAKRNGRSLSQEIQLRLQQSLHTPASALKLKGEKRDRALAALVNHMANATNVVCDDSWHTSPFVFETLRIGWLMLLERLRPAGELAVPSAIAEMMDRERQIVPLPPDMTPQQVAARQASAIVGGMWWELQNAERPPLNHPRNHFYTDEFYTFPAWREALGLDRENER